MHGTPIMLYALIQIRQQEMERATRYAWHRTELAEPAVSRRAQPRQVRLDTVAGGC
jgi:hypothetical protein